MKLRIATRKSALALAQTRAVAAQLQSLNRDLEIEEVHVVTQGDRILDRPLAEVGGKGLFVSEVEAALEEGRADLAVHSLKDVPSDLGAGLELLCIPMREDARDVLVTKQGATLDELREGARVGTSSLRRSCQLAAKRPDLSFAPLRGNVDTRLRKLDDGAYDAIVLAAAGLKRLGIAPRPLWPIPIELSLPAVGQGALALEGRADDDVLKSILSPLEHPHTRLEVEAERACLKALEGGCQTPIAVFGKIGDDGMSLVVQGMVGSADGDRIVEDAVSTTLDESHGALRTAREAGHQLALLLLSRGARTLLAGLERNVKR